MKFWTAATLKAQRLRSVAAVGAEFWCAEVEDVNSYLDDAQVRVLGALIEKQVTTPDYYPLTLNALVQACNQITNRDPVVSYDERTVARALESLREKNLAYVFYGSDSRVPKYKHVATEVLKLSPPELAVTCVLLLRGPQTPGEIRGRTGRLHNFSSLQEVEATLEQLAGRDEPLVVRLPRQPGRKEARYAHLLSGSPSVEEADSGSVGTGDPPAGTSGQRLARLEAEVADARSEIDELRRQFDEFRKQFE